MSETPALPREVLRQKAAAWDEGYAQAVADHLLVYDGSDDTPTPTAPERTDHDRPS